ncbi:MAG: STAS domain-containing protein [Brevinematia bacterium]
MSSGSNITIYFTSDGILVKVIGKGIVEYCRDLKEDLEKLISEYEKLNVYFDLSETTHLDSTFIGLMVVFEKKLSNLNKGNFFILNPSQRVLEILSSMDLLDVLKITNIDVHVIGKYKDIKENIQKDIIELKLLIETHNHLIQTGEKNRELFSSLEKALKEELERYEKQNGESKE